MYNFLKYREKFLNAVFYTDTDEFFKLVEEGGFSTLFTNDMKIFSNDALPIHYITICWNIILSKYNEFKDEYKQKVYEKKCKNDRIKEFFIKEQHLDMEHIPFQSYSGHFYSDDTDETAEDCLCCSLEDLQKAHYRQIDIDLYCYVCKFGFENVELLLKQGADPNVTFFEDTDNEMGEKDNMLSVDVVPDISVHDDATLISQLTAEIQPLVPDMQVLIVVDHNYSE